MLLTIDTIKSSTTISIFFFCRCFTSFPSFFLHCIDKSSLTIDTIRNLSSLKHWWVSALRRQGALFLTARLFWPFWQPPRLEMLQKVSYVMATDFRLAVYQKSHSNSSIFLVFSLIFLTHKKPTSVCYDFIFWYHQIQFLNGVWPSK